MSVHVDTRPFNAMCRALATMVPGLSVEHAVDYEASKVLEKTLGTIPAAKATRIRQKHREQEFTQVDAGRGRKLYKLSHRYPDSVWAAIHTARTRSLSRKLGAVGLSKQAIQQINQIAGLPPIKAPASVAKARPGTGRIYQNARASRTRTGGRYILRVGSAMPTLGVRQVAGQRKLSAAMAARVSYFRTNLKHRVFDSAATIAKRYPGVTAHR